MSMKMLIKSLSSENTVDILPTILIILLVSCILFCIGWMIVSLIKKRSQNQYISSQREAAAAAFFANENLRVIDDVYTQAGEHLGKVSSYHPILYSIESEVLGPGDKHIKPLGVEKTESNRMWIHLLARKPTSGLRVQPDKLIKIPTMTSRFKFASVLAKSAAEKAS